MYNSIFKRVIDLIICIMALPIFVILYIIVGLAIKLDDRGPIIYKASRIGKGSKIFNMYKFRSMKVNSPNILNSDGSTFNSKNDGRLIKIGRVIRETSIDEVPQILNVIKGDMSIIGPRASMEDALPTYKKDEIDKMLVRPGITGFTQAYFRNGLTVREKRLRDAWYANNVSLILDIKIFFKTIITVVKRESIYTVSESQVVDNLKHKEIEVLVPEKEEIEV